MRAVASSSALLADEIGELSGGAHELSTRAEQQAASLEESAAALHQITATVKASKDGVTRARTVVAAADNEAKRGAQVIDQAVAAMNGLSQSAREIREITGLIDEIAFQTNLLALNAGVEAARAGGAGRGFAVVATEVRALAQRSADMAKRISDLISNSDRQVQAGVAKVDATGEALGRIAGEVGRLNEIVDSIAQGAADQARGLDEISAAMRELEQTTQSNAGMAGRTSAATQRVSQEIGSLDGRMRQFRFALDSDHLKAVRRAHVRAHA
jgi:methyl-accepting chemotaxis protein